MEALPDKQGICAILCDREALRFPRKYNQISNINMHVRCVTCSSFQSELCTQLRVQNMVVNTLRRKITLLVTLRGEITRFDCLFEIIAEHDENFNELRESDKTCLLRFLNLL